jgi:hypothetical protein
MKHLFNSFVAFLCCSYFLAAQDIPLIDSLKKQLNNSITNEQKIIWLRELRSWYSGIDPIQAPQYAYMELKLAETSLDNKLRFQALLDNASFQFYSGHKLAYDSAIYFAQKAIELSKEEHCQENVAWGNLFLANIANYKAEKEKEINYLNEANTIAANSTSDSLHWACNFSYAVYYDSKNDKLPAFRSYLNALNIAESSKQNQTILASYTALVDFYYSLGNYNKAKDYAFKALNLSKKINAPYTRITLYDKLGMIYTDDKNYELASASFINGLKLIDTFRFPFSFKNQIYNHIMRQYFLKGDYEKVLLFFNTQKDLQNYYKENKLDYFANTLRARLFVYTNKMDSASIYFKMAEHQIDSIPMNAGGINRLFYEWYADYFRKSGDIKNAIVYFTKLKKLSQETNQLDDLLKATANLDSMFILLGDYKTAYSYKNLYHIYKDSLQKLTNEKELMSTEIAQETFQREKAEKQAELEKQTRYNIQYMGITAALAALLILLVMAGVFSVSTNSIKAIGFFTFIFLFEFIVVLTDEKIHRLTHGEPWKVVLIKIILACILVPLHHYAEQKVINYLSTQKLLNLSKNTIFQKLHKPKSGEVEKVSSDNIKK